MGVRVKANLRPEIFGLGHLVVPANHLVVPNQQ